MVLLLLLYTWILLLSLSASGLLFRDLFSKYSWWKRKAALGFFIGSFTFVFTGNFKLQCLNNGNPAGITEFSKIRLCWTLFGRSRSRWFGKIMELHVPVAFRPLVFRTYAFLTGIDLREMKYPLESYKSLAHVFTRTLKDGVRPIEESNNPDVLTMPCDGRIVNLSDIGFNAERLTQIGSNPNSDVGPIKGATFRIESFLGVDPRFNLGNSSKKINDSNKTKFVYAVIYLAPSDYHHFHSPCEMGIQVRRHMPGTTLPVFTSFASKLNDLFSVNERIVLSGRWKYGQIHYAAVASYNVGNIRLKWEPNFSTNVLRTGMYFTRRVMAEASYVEPEFDEDYIKPTLRKIGPAGSETPVSGHWVEKGERIGEFRLGSTVVLILEVPDSFTWSVGIGDKVKLGQKLGQANTNL